VSNNIFVWDAASQSAKCLDMLKTWGRGSPDWTYVVGADIFGRWKGLSSKFSWNTFCNKLLSTKCFLCYHTLEKMWFLKFVSYQPSWEKFTRLCKNIVTSHLLSILERWPHSFEVFHSHSSCCCQQRTSNLAQRPKATSFSEYCAYLIKVPCFIFHGCSFSLTTLSIQFHICATCHKLHPSKKCLSKHCSWS